MRLRFPTPPPKCLLLPLLFSVFVPDESPASGTLGLLTGTSLDLNHWQLVVDVQSSLSFLSDNFTMLIYRHNLVIAENARQRWLEAVQRKTEVAKASLARTKSYETVIDR